MDIFVQNTKYADEQDVVVQDRKDENVEEYCCRRIGRMGDENEQDIIMQIEQEG